MKDVYVVRIFRDDEANVWVASSENFVGVATEADTLDHLMQKLDVMVPEMLEANGYINADHHDVPYEIINQRVAHGHSCH